VRNSIRISAIIIVVACLVVAAVTVAGAQDKPSTRASGKAVRAHASALRGLADIAPDVAALRIAHGPSDAVDDRLVRSPLLGDGVADPGLSRRVGFSRPAWFVPGSDGRSICVLTSASLNCPPNSDVEDHGLAPSISWTAEGPVRVSGIASDAVTTAEIVRSDGTSVSVAVTNNLLDYASDDAPRKISWTGPDGPHTVVFPDIKGR
jgi:hypothetical protein